MIVLHSLTAGQDDLAVVHPDCSWHFCRGAQYTTAAATPLQNENHYSHHRQAWKRMPSEPDFLTWASTVKSWKNPKGLQEQCFHGSRRRPGASIMSTPANSLLQSGSLGSGKVYHIQPASSRGLLKTSRTLLGTLQGFF